MSRLSGFPEYQPEQRIVEQSILDHLRTIFELHGFGSVETRAVEPLDVLVRKGEIDKEVYLLRRLQDREDKQESGLGLHFDLTVPFARYVVENSNALDFPFRRYQIQKVWRGERPQAGRFREFTQADIDIVARDVLPLHFDIEVAQVMAEALAGLPVRGATLQISNRKILQGFYLGLGISAPEAVMQVIDKLDKLPADAIADQLATHGLSTHQIEACIALAAICTPDAGFVDQVRDLGIDHPMLDEGLGELQSVIEGIRTPDKVAVHADLRIARGLDYYTGTVFETRLAGHEGLGSICSGGRYEELARDNRSTYPGVGISLGVSRVLAALFADGLGASRAVPSVVLVAIADEDDRAAADATASRLRARGISTEVAPVAAKFGKQIRHAERRGIPYVWFGGPDGDQVKDIRSGDQVSADSDTWSPPSHDLRPQVTYKETSS